MHVDIIEDFETLVRVRANWEQLYEADPDAHVFLTWRWTAGLLASHHSLWFVLAVKRAPADAEYVAFLPLRTLVRFESGRGFHNEVAFAGSGFATYSGVLVHPDCEAEAVRTLADHLRLRVDWARIHMTNLRIPERRRRILLAAFNRPPFRAEPDVPIDRRTGTDNAICPFAELPSDWDSYLARLSANNRQKIRRLLRKLESSDERRITMAAAETFGRDIETLVTFWRRQWESDKGERTAQLLVLMRDMLMRCADGGALMLPVFWEGDRPVAALALVIDRSKRSMLFLAGGRDASYTGLPAGYLLHAFSIRWAISEGIRTYDFMHGDEPYKYHFADRERRLTSTTIAAKSNRNCSGRLDPRGLERMLEQALELETAGAIADAELAYRQVVELAPDNALALYRFGRFMALRNAHSEARGLLERSLATDPCGDNAWRMLVRTLQALGDAPAALAACRKLLALRPNDPETLATIVRLSGRPVLNATPAQAHSQLDPGWVLQRLAEVRV